MSAKIKRRHHRPMPGVSQYRWQNSMMYERWYVREKNSGLRPDPDRVNGVQCMRCGRRLVAHRHWRLLKHYCMVVRVRPKTRRNDKNRRKVRP